jgi:hypothetical protein
MEVDMQSPARLGLPVAVIGAGPVGLAAAAHLLAQGEEPLLLEAGSTVGAAVASWAHVQLFSPWRYNIDPAARELLEASGWTAPDGDAYPTGRELIDRYLAPLARLPEISSRLRLKADVRAVARRGLDKMKTAGREQAPFELTVYRESRDERILAKAVIDASGTLRTPNPLGSSGVPAMGEDDPRLTDRITRGLPDVLGPKRGQYADRRVLVVGSGHSALTVIRDLVALRHEAPHTRVLWAIRRKIASQTFGGGDHDELPERGRLGSEVKLLLAAGEIELYEGVRITELRWTPSGVVVSASGQDLPPVDEVIAATGFRPDLSVLRELRISLDPAVESPPRLAPLIDPNLHSCGTVPPHGFAELAHPEPNFYIAGMKSYGRAPTFLMLTGYEQVRSIVAALTGDLRAAQRVQLVLPQTGVCSGPGLAASCCSPASGSTTTCCAAEPIRPQSERSSQSRASA